MEIYVLLGASLAFNLFQAFVFFATCRLIKTDYVKKS